MAEQPQTIVETVFTEKPLGSRNEANLQKAFSASPLPGYLGELSDDERKTAYQSLALDGIVANGLGFNSFNRDYADAPSMANVETGGGGKPASAYVPNLTSPGPGSVFPNDQAAYEGELPAAGTEFGSGLGSTGAGSSPSETSAEISGQTLGDYILGPVNGISKSYAGSQGGE